MPIEGPSSELPVYRLGDSALAGQIAVKETGVVSALMIENLLDVPLLLLGGWTVRGGKQNRVLVTNVLLAPRTATTISSACVEAGRWRHLREFSRPPSQGARSSPPQSTGSAPHSPNPEPKTNFMLSMAAPSSLRRMLARDVARGARTHRQARADQGNVWEEVARYLLAATCVSPTSDLLEGMSKAQQTTPLPAKPPQLPDDAVGAAFFLRGRLLGIEIFDRASAFKEALPNLTRSYYLETVYGYGDEPSLPADRSLEAVTSTTLQSAAEAPWSWYSGAGLGTNLCLAHGELVGNALSYDGSVLYAQISEPRG